MKYTGKPYGGRISHIGADVIIRAPGESRLRSARICEITEGGTPKILSHPEGFGCEPMMFLGEKWDGFVPKHLDFVKTNTAFDIEALPEGSWTWQVRV